MDLAIADHFETRHPLASTGQFDGKGDCHTPKAFVRQAFRKCLECGIFAHGLLKTLGVKVVKVWATMVDGKTVDVAKDQADTKTRAHPG